MTTEDILRPDQLQAQASDPQASVWVNASAGTGKTKVLTDRVLRLMLAGNAPEKLLCITFTKAAAAEMASRIQNRLARWTALDEASLTHELQQLTGQQITLALCNRARQLFGLVVDTPGGLKIQTIHSFCTSILKRFPLEAGIAPQFDILSDQDGARLIQQAMRHLLQQTEDHGLSVALNHLTATLSEKNFANLAATMLAERRKLKDLLVHQDGLTGALERIYHATDFDPKVNIDQYILDFCQNDMLGTADLRHVVSRIHGATSKTEQKIMAVLPDFLTAAPSDRYKRWNDFTSLFLTKDGEILKTLVTRKYQDVLPIMQDCADRIVALNARISTARAGQYSAALLQLGTALIQRYDAVKRHLGMLDYEDQILLTRDLLRDRLGAQWVLYKLDGGIDHILVDEAQDTNPAQWAIIQALCAEFFSGNDGHDARDGPRTLFVVGDEKQSIYGFQGAEPQSFHAMRDYFAAKVRDAGHIWHEISLDTSFRSTAPVLALVDAIFHAGNPAHDGVIRPGRPGTRHIAHRQCMAGRVECWPILVSETGDDNDCWTIPGHDETDLDTGNEAIVQLAMKIADHVHKLIQTAELPARGRAVQPGDILILVRKRDRLVNLIMLYLKRLGLPVAGFDRMVIKSQIAVQDLMALAQFVLTPADDLNFACLLTSPMIGLDDNALMVMATRNSTLWQTFSRMAEQDQPTWRPIRDWLDQWLRQADAIPPYEFFGRILQQPCPGHPQSGRAALMARLGRDILDPVEEFLQIAIDFQMTHPPLLGLFVDAFANDDRDIKRELDQGGGTIRIMTVHGSKGLQAPIVIMPQTILFTPLKPPDILWPDSPDDVFLWAPNRSADCPLLAERRERAIAAAYAEYHRLLYVALTRAEDRLIIAGYMHKRARLDQSWYQHIKAGMLHLHPTADPEAIVEYETSQQGPTKPDHIQESVIPPIEGRIESWLLSAPPAPPDDLRQTLAPSRMAIAGQEPAVFSPFAQNNAMDPFRRGILIHRLLQSLPDVQHDHRASTAQRWLARHAPDMARDHAALIMETLKIIDHPVFAPVFGPDSRAEVPLTGMVDGQPIDARLDRLVVLPHRVLVVDFKTNRPPPTDPADVAPIYRQQMRIYAAALRQLYPDRKVEAALLWTALPLLMPIAV